MKKNQKQTENVINSSVNVNQKSDADLTSVAEKDVKKRKAKAEKQTNEEHKTDSLWGGTKYVIL